MGVSAIAILAVMGLGGCSTHADQWFEPGSADYEQSGSAEDLLTHPTPEALMRAAAQTRERGDPVSASALYHRAYAMEPDNPEALVGLGEALLEAGETDDAIASFRAALQLSNGNAAAMQGLGKALIVVDRPDEAIMQFRAALGIRPDPAGYNGLGVALDMSGAHGEAQEAYRHGLAMDGENLSLQNNLGLSLALTDQFGEAIAVLRKVAAHPRSTVRARQNLALAYGMSGDADMAARIASIDLPEADVEANVAYYAWLRKQPKPTAARAIGRGSGLAPQAPAGAGRALSAAPVINEQASLDGASAGSAPLDPALPEPAPAAAAAAAPVIKEEASADGAAAGAASLEPAMPEPVPEPESREVIVGRATMADRPDADEAEEPAARRAPVLPVVEVAAAPSQAAVESPADEDAAAAGAATPDFEISPTPDPAAADPQAEAAPAPVAEAGPEFASELMPEHAAELVPEVVTEVPPALIHKAAGEAAPELAYAPPVNPAGKLTATLDSASADTLTELAVTAEAVQAGIERHSVLTGLVGPAQSDILELDIADIVHAAVERAPKERTEPPAATKSADLFADPSYKFV